MAQLFSLGIVRAMKTEEHNKGVSFRVPDAACKHICSAITSIPGVVITKKRRSIWSVDDVGAEFTFRGHSFVIEPDEWDGVFWILSQKFQKHEAEMLELREAVERFVIPRCSAAGFWRIFADTSHDHDA